MIEESTMIQILDIDIGESKPKPVLEVYREYLSKAKCIETVDYNILDFSNLDVHIQDWTGWTKLLLIKKWIAPRSVRTLTAMWCPAPLITVYDYTLVPVYKMQNAVRGFHGEVKFAYDLKPATDLQVGNLLRVRGLDNGDQFSPISAIKSSDSDRAFYEIITKSKFYNANNVHLWGGTIEQFIEYTRDQIRAIQYK